MACSMWPSVSRPEIAPIVYSGAALAATLDGDLREAGRLQAEGKAQSSSLQRYWYLSDAALMARERRFSQLLRYVEEHREAAEGTITGLSMRRLQLLEAFATHELAKGEDEYRGLHSGADIKAMLHGIRAGRLDTMALRWGELREFMGAFGLLGSPLA